MNVGDTVLVFSKYEGTVLELRGSKAMVYCPDFDEAEPYLVTEIDNLIVLQKTLIN